MISPTAKSVVASDEVNVNSIDEWFDVSPLETVLDIISIVGAISSTSVTSKVTSTVSLVLPAASVALTIKL